MRADDVIAELCVEDLHARERSPSMNTVADPRFTEPLDDFFPGAIPEREFVAESTRRLAAEGFTSANTLACVAVCRDEATSPLFSAIHRVWGPVFNIASLAGMVTAGRTGLAAAVEHAPVEDGRRRLVVFAMAHIALDIDGTIGRFERPGLPEPSRACGALGALLDELRSGVLKLDFDRYDAEQSLLKQRLLPVIGDGNVPGLVELTKLAAAAIEDDIRAILDSVTGERETTDRGTTIDTAMFSGIQVHGPHGVNFVWPRSVHIEIAGELRNSEIPAEDSRIP